jgi:hypothetical protein
MAVRESALWDTIPIVSVEMTQSESYPTSTAESRTLILGQGMELMWSSGRRHGVSSVNCNDVWGGLLRSMLPDGHGYPQWFTKQKR